MPGGRRLAVDRAEDGADGIYRPASPTAAAAAAKPSGGGVSAGSKDQYKLSEEQKAVLKRVSKEGLSIEYDQVNPKRAGSMSFTRYEVYKRATTVAQFLSLGGVTADLAFDYSRGYLTLPTEGALATFVASVEGSDAEKRGSSSDSSSSSVSSGSSSGSSISSTNTTCISDGGSSNGGRSSGGSGNVGSKRLAPKVDTPFEVSYTKVASGSPLDVLPVPRPVENAFAVSEVDIAAAAAKGEVKLEDSSEEELDDGRGCAAALDAAAALYAAGNYSDARAAAERVLAMGSAEAPLLARLAGRAKRLRGLAVMKTTAVGATKTNLRGASGVGAVAAKTCSFGQQELPTRHEDPTRVRRDVAKESKGELAARHEPKGAQALFEGRLKQFLNALLDAELNGAAGAEETDSASGSCVVPVKYRFGSDEEVFELHRGGLVPAHAAMPASQAKPRAAPQGDVGAVVALLQAASASRLKAVDLYGRWGVTALALAARARSRGGAAEASEPVAALLALGADLCKALDGALYLSQTTGDLSWAMGLLAALEVAKVPNFGAVVKYARLTGETALLVAVGQHDLEAVRALLAMGACVAQVGQKDKDGKTCLQLAAKVAEQKASSALHELLRGHPTATPTAESS
jgi:hypothetical protein